MQLTVYGLTSKLPTYLALVSRLSHAVLPFHKQALNVSFLSCVKLSSMEDFSVVQTRHGLLWREYSLLELVTHLQTLAESLWLTGRIYCMVLYEHSTHIDIYFAAFQYRAVFIWVGNELCCAVKYLDVCEIPYHKQLDVPWHHFHSHMKTVVTST